MAELLREAVRSGDLKSGERIQSARDMAKRYGVSLMTTQKAIDVLKSEGVLVGYAGRGTFVSSGEPERADAPSPEYQAILGQLNEFGSRMTDLEERIDQLERALHGGAANDVAEQDRDPSS